MQVRPDFIPRAGLRLSAGTSGYRSLRPAVEDMSMTSSEWRALGRVVVVYFAISGPVVTAQDLQPGRATFAEMVAFARLASVPCKRLASGRGKLSRASSPEAYKTTTHPGGDCRQGKGC